MSEVQLKNIRKKTDLLQEKGIKRFNQDTSYIKLATIKLMGANRSVVLQ